MVSPARVPAAGLTPVAGLTLVPGVGAPGGTGPGRIGGGYTIPAGGALVATFVLMTPLFVTTIEAWFELDPAPMFVRTLEPVAPTLVESPSE